MHKKSFYAGAVTITCIICACIFIFSKKIPQALGLDQGQEDGVSAGDALSAGSASYGAGSVQSDYTGKTFTFTGSGEEYKAALNSDVDPSPYDNDKFVRDGNKVSYSDGTYTSRLGVDVSYYQGDINWKKVKAAGYEFAFIRVGYRGYGSSGTLNLDKNFVKNAQEAQAAGIDVGVYFFSQATSTKEARKEAAFVIKALEDNDITPDLPIVFDPEKVLTSGSRTLNLDDEQFTKNSVAFCREIKKSGYEAAVYTSMLWEAFTIDLSQLSGTPIWYADYVDKPQTPYNFRWWQYSDGTKVDGIPIQCDLDVEVYRK